MFCAREIRFESDSVSELLKFAIDSLHKSRLYVCEAYMSMTYSLTSFRFPKPVHFMPIKSLSAHKIYSSFNRVTV